mgnify:CR=1 FL=1
MPWSTSNRRQRLPKDWDRRRAVVLSQAAGRCQATTHAPDCDGRATDVDHIIPGDNHTRANLQALSAACHRAKTAHESAQRNQQRAAMRRRQAETHPGALH